MTDQPDEVRRCAWCGTAFRPKTIGRRAIYCGRNCRQRAYEGRREQERIASALEAASNSSRDEKKDDR